MTKEFLLWENPDPTVEFATQTIELDLSEYDRVGVIYALTANYQPTFYTEGVIGKTLILESVNMPSGSQTYGYTYKREAVISTDGIVFSEGKYHVVSLSAPVTENIRCVPLKIYGIKVNKTTEITDDTITITDTLPVSRGGTGAMTPVNARANLELSGSTTKTLLWTNASPTSDFTGQTFALDATEYDQLEIIANRKVNSTDVLFNSFIIPIGINGNDKCCTTTGFVYGATSKLYCVYRTVQYTASTKQIYFSAAYVASESQDTANNAVCIPLEIYGIKILS